MDNNIRKATHCNVAPLINERCDTLLLGSMLSTKSAEARFYYAHPQNRFWRVLAAVFDRELPADNSSRAALALDNGIALWDVIAECEMVGSSDSTIKNPVYNDIVGLIARFPNIRRIFTTGGKAHELLLKYNKTVKADIVSDAVRLPSTSPLNCAASLEKLINAYSVLKK